MVRLKKRCDEKQYVRSPVINDNVELKCTPRLEELLNNGQPTDIDEFFDALDEYIDEFNKATFGE